MRIYLRMYYVLYEHGCTETIFYHTFKQNLRVDICTCITKKTHLTANKLTFINITYVIYST